MCAIALFLNRFKLKQKLVLDAKADLEQNLRSFGACRGKSHYRTLNLHDVSARFQKIVGIAWQRPRVLTMLTSNLPGDIVNALIKANGKTPGLMASMENIAAMNSSLQARRSAFQPRLDLRARAERGNNIDYVSGRTNNNTAEVVASWNLFNGGTDKAKAKEAADQVNYAKDIRDKTCRDIRQTLTIAFNDTRKLTDQLGFLDQHQLSIEKPVMPIASNLKSVNAPLLDLLDTENELFQAKRAFANAEVDLYFAYARTHAGIGQLQSTLGLENTLSRNEKLEDKSETGMMRGSPAEAPNL